MAVKRVMMAMSNTIRWKPNFVSWLGFHSQVPRGQALTFNGSLVAVEETKVESSGKGKQYEQMAMESVCLLFDGHADGALESVLARDPFASGKELLANKEVDAALGWKCLLDCWEEEKAAEMAKKITTPEKKKAPEPEPAEPEPAKPEPEQKLDEKEPDQCAQTVAEEEGQVKPEELPDASTACGKDEVDVEATDFWSKVFPDLILPQPVQDLLKEHGSETLQRMLVYANTRNRAEIYQCRIKSTTVNVTLRASPGSLNPTN